MNTYHLGGPAQDQIILQEEDQRVWLQRLFGLACGRYGADDGPPRTQGLALLATSQGRFEGRDLRARIATPGAGQVRIDWQVADTDVRLESLWEASADTGLVSRRDRLVNAGPQPVTIYRCLARFAFPPEQYEVYYQQSSWSNENQGAWVPLGTGSLVLGCEWGRTTRGCTPYLVLRPIGSHAGVAFHLLPQGNWTARVSAHAVMGDLSYAVVELGLADEDLRLQLSPGEDCDLPEIWLQAVPQGEPCLAAPQLHRYVNQRYFAAARPFAPLVYNTWFDRFDELDVPRLHQQLAAARAVGCEAFVIDAGWFGPSSPGWWNGVGDWREKADVAFQGQMGAFAEAVRAAGLGFGLWMEPERFSTSAPVCQIHPEWFIPVHGDLARLDLENQSAYLYLRSEIERLIETYQLAWMKIDFNFELGYDPTGAELYRYYDRWYRLLNEIRLAHPATFFEGCASGGMRLDLHTLSHFDGHFLSDTVNPLDVLRIAQGALLRLPPGRLARWLVLRAVQGDFPGSSQATRQARLLTPCGAGWEACESVDLEFAALAALPGMFGLSGDLASLPPEVIEQLRKYIDFYKQWRSFITASSAYLLTPPRPKYDRTGWVALQLSHPQQAASLLFAYRLASASDQLRVRLRDLQADRLYQLERFGAPDEPLLPASGAALMETGLTVALPAANRAALYLLQPAAG